MLVLFSVAGTPTAATTTRAFPGSCPCCPSTAEDTAEDTDTNTNGQKDDENNSGYTGTDDDVDSTAHCRFKERKIIL